MNKVVIFKGKARVEHSFMDEAVGKNFLALAQERFGADNVHLVSCTAAIAPPSGFIPNHRPIWCPYCAEERRFVYSTRIESKKCPVCGISDRDFYVKKYNLSFGEGDTKNKTKRKRVKRMERGSLE